MKTIILYYSKHHQNTKKLLDAIQEKYDVQLLDITETPVPDLEEYDRIGFASGIYYSKFHKDLIRIAKEKLPERKEVFFISTCGALKDSYSNSIKAEAEKHDCIILGQFTCLGFDTYGPLKFIGGLAKGHPDDTDIQNAIEFYGGL